MSDEQQSLWEAPKVEIADKEYQLRRLGIKDLHGLWSVTRDVADQLDLSIFEGEDELGREQLGIELFSQILNVGPEAYEKMVEWLIGIVDGLDKEDIDDPDKVPVHAPFTVLEKLPEHEDFTQFFTKGSKAMKAMKGMDWDSLVSSTKSQTDTDGKTDT